MKLWGLFIISIGTLFILIYPDTSKIINLIMGVIFILIGIFMIIKGRKK